MTNENPRGLPVADAWTDIMDTPYGLAQVYSHDPNEQPRGRYVLATDYAALQADLAAAIARAEAAERIGLELQGRAQRAEVDAARYRWLRHGDNDEAIIRGPVKDGAYLLRNGNLDAAIDAAMAAEGRE